MANKITSMLSRLAAPFLKHTLALLTSCAVVGVIGSARADIPWTGGSGVFSNGDNWYGGASPTSTDSIQFSNEAAGDTITFDGENGSVNNVHFVWIGEASNYAQYPDTGAVNPVILKAADPSSNQGLNVATAIKCGDGENQRAAFIVESGTYTSAEISYWCWGGSNRLYAKIAGGSMIYPEFATLLTD